MLGLRYPAIIHLTDDRSDKLRRVDFPNCPGAAFLTLANRDVQAVARERLVAWLEARLAEGAAVARPQEPDLQTMQVLFWVPVPPELAAQLSASWARASVSQSPTSH